MLKGGVALSILAVTLLLTAGPTAVGVQTTAPGGLGGLSPAPAPNRLPGTSQEWLAAAPAEPNLLSLVPAPSGTSSTCVVAGASNPYPTATTGYLNFNGDLFNLPSGSVGQTELCYNETRGTLSDRTLFSQLPGAPRYGVLGYPEAIYGENIYGGPVGRQSALLPVPHEQIRNLTSSAAWVSLNYSVIAPGNSPYDFAWDDWFSEVPANASSSGNVGNRIELMIWYSNDIGMSLPQTPIAVPTFMDGMPAPGTWLGDHYCQGSNEVTFDYLYAPDGMAPGYGLPSAQVALNFTYLLDNVSATLRAGACWAAPGTDIGSLYMDNSPLGAEFYPTTANTADVNWTVSSLCYTFVGGPATSSGVSCHPNDGGTGAPLAATIHATPEGGASPLHVQFTATVSGGTAPYAYSWNFGDGSSAGDLTGTNHTYLRAGMFTAQLSVTDSSTKGFTANATIGVTARSAGGHAAAVPPLDWALVTGGGIAVAAFVFYLARRLARRRTRREERVA